MSCSCMSNIKEPYINEQKDIYLTTHFDIPHESSPEWKNYIRHVMKEVKNNDGLILEFGVWTGYSINTIAEYFQDRTIYGFDSFIGLKEQWGPLHKGMFNTKGRLPNVKPNVNLVVGMFEDVLPKFCEEKFSSGETISFLHVDCDLYSSTKTILENLKPYIVCGTVIAFDEIHHLDHCLNGEMKAFKEFDFDYEWIAHTQDVQAALIIK